MQSVGSQETIGDQNPTLVETKTKLLQYLCMNMYMILCMNICTDLIEWWLFWVNMKTLLSTVGYIIESMWLCECEYACSEI